MIITEISQIDDIGWISTCVLLLLLTIIIITWLLAFEHNGIFNNYIFNILDNIESFVRNFKYLRLVDRMTKRFYCESTIIDVLKESGKFEKYNKKEVHQIYIDNEYEIKDKLNIIIFMHLKSCGDIEIFQKELRKYLNGEDEFGKTIIPRELPYRN